MYRMFVFFPSDISVSLSLSLSFFSYRGWAFKSSEEILVEQMQSLVKEG